MSNPAVPAERVRYKLLDELRGFAVFCMIFYHGFYTLSEFGVPFGDTLMNFFMPAEPYFAAFFILLSGAMCQLSHSNLLRGAKLAVIAAAITLITVVGGKIGFEGCEIYFGILHLLSVGMLLTALLNPLFKMLPIIPFALLFLLLFVLTLNVEIGEISVGGRVFCTLPSSLYETDVLQFLGFHGDNFFSADYFPILPWLFLFFCGAMLGLYEPRGKFPSFFKKSRIPFFGFLGKHALVVYIVHQPLFFGIGCIIEYLTAR